MRMKKSCVVGLLLASLFAFSAITWGQQNAEQSNMNLVGYNDVLGRDAYMPIIQSRVSAGYRGQNL